MRRKLVQQGQTTMMVSLPAKWIKENQLNKGDEVNIEENGNQLILGKKTEILKRKTEISLTNETESSVRTAVVNTYRAGYDEIKIFFKDDKVHQIILKTLRKYLLGFEVTKRKENYCIIEKITEPSGDKFDLLLKKMFYNISLLIDGTEKRLKGEPFDDYQEIVWTIHQYDNFCRRVIVKKNLFGPESNLMWMFLGILVHGQRELFHLNQFLKNKKIILKNTLILTQLKELFEELKEGYIYQKIEKLEKVHELEKKIIYHDVYQMLSKNKKSQDNYEKIILFHLSMAVKHFYLSSSPLIGWLLSSNNSK